MGDKGRSSNLPPGFRFFPTDGELIVHFLRPKSAASLPSHQDFIPILDICLHDPWDLNGKALIGGDGFWYFFSRTHNRVTTNGYWKVVSSDEPVAINNKTVGIKKFLCFFIGEAPEGVKTNWMMHEFRLLDSNSSDSTSKRTSRKRAQHMQECGSFVLCRVFEASGCCDDGTELSCLDEVFLSLDDLEEEEEEEEEEDVTS